MKSVEASKIIPIGHPQGGRMSSYHRKLFASRIASILLLFTVSSKAATPAIPAALISIAPAITNKPVPVYFEAWPTNDQYYTNHVYVEKTTVANLIKTNGGMVFVSNVVATATVFDLLLAPQVTNSMVTCTVGTNRDIALTNFYQRVITNRGPVTFWLPPTNRYVFTLWALDRLGKMSVIQQTDWPTAPSNQLRFISTPTFSSNLRDWTTGTNSYSFTVTNGVGFGTNQFVRWITSAVKDDFTPRAVVFDANTFVMFPTNTP